MTTFRHKLHSCSMIPWVVALVALFGCSVVASPKVVLRNSAIIDGEGDSATQIVNEGATVLSVKRYIPIIVNGSSNRFSLKLPLFQRIVFDLCEGPLELPRRGGLAQGRAPPSGLCC